MKKLKLNELKVESFETASSRKETGTIKGNAFEKYDSLPNGGGCTWWPSCVNTCNQDTCAANCDPNLSRVYCILTDDCNNPKTL